MFRYNLMTSQLALAGLQQVMPSPTWENALSIAALFVQDPAFAVKLTRSLAAMPLVHYHYAHYPESRDDRKLARWIHNARLLVS
jgi:hypothetical protein